MLFDSPNNYYAWRSGRGSDEKYILFDRPWNEKINATNRVSSIKEALDIINAQ